MSLIWREREKLTCNVILTQFSTDWPMMTPHCMFILVNAGMHQKLRKTQCMLTRKQKMKTNVISINENLNLVTNIF